MVWKIADNIYSPLGVTTAANYAAVSQGRSMLRSYEAGTLGVPEPFTASLFYWDSVPSLEGYTRFERIVIQSIAEALSQTAIDPHSNRLLFILATTKGNIGLLDACPSPYPQERVLPGVAAQTVARHFGFRHQPLVVSNACISGLSAQLTAMRLLQGGAYDVAVVCGADVLSRFIVSGFSSLKALSPCACRPFDIERVGLNLGEAAATIVYAARPLSSQTADAGWQAVSGAVRNDAYHISSPSPRGEGCCQAIRAALGESPAADLAFVNAHGTATLYNDQMESAAIHRAGLSAVPVNSLKGYYGHTMGAAGVLETVLSMAALDHGIIPATRGYEELGVSHSLMLSASHQPTGKRAFLKLLSGFGGCNAAMLFRKGGVS